MLTLLFWATIVLVVAGFVFSMVYLWINIFGSFHSLPERNAAILKITRASMVLAPIFALLSSLLSTPGEVAVAISSSATLFSVISISWLVVIFACGVITLISVLSKSRFKPTLSSTIKQIFVIALAGAIISLVFAWLFS